MVRRDVASAVAGYLGGGSVGVLKKYNVCHLATYYRTLHDINERRNNLEKRNRVAQ